MYKHIAEQSNLYALQSNISLSSEVLENEIKTSLGMLIAMDLHKMQHVDDY